MSGFDARWRDLASAARLAEHEHGAGDARIDARTAAAIAARARREQRAPEVSNLRGLVIAAALFAAALPVLGWGAHELGLLAPLAGAARDLGELARSAPPTSFIPPPPTVPDLEPKLAFGFLDHWFATLPTEIPR